MTDQLRVLCDSLERNAAAFRRQGHEGCADESERLLARLLEAMAAAPAAVSGT